MAFIYRRGATIGRWSRLTARSFLDWEKREGVLPPELCDAQALERCKSANLPVQKATKFDFVINLKSSKTDWFDDCSPRAGAGE